jgi:hypothetical protein
VIKTRFSWLWLLLVSATVFEAQTYAQLPEAPAAASSAAPAIATPDGKNAGPGVAFASVEGHGPGESSSADSGDAALPAEPAPASDDSVSLGVDSSSVPPESYHWRGLFWQSLEFTGAEDTYRLTTDPYMRHLIADEPFWHNYIASLEQWNMHRWNDGDDFLVDYIGHPMQGGVSGFIEIQNSPRQKYLRISGSRDYWDSKLHALMWSTVFSTQQKIGPLGEAGLGNAGGYTYPLHCPYPCKGYEPGVTKYTNNTGWTDFITTPAIGTLWTVLEDFLDREVSDPIAARLPGKVAGKIVRGSLNPTRAMANFMRGKNPWYRDWQHTPEMASGLPRLPQDGSAARSESGGYVSPRFELFPHLDAISLPVNTATCTGCRQMLYGPGVGFSAGLTHWVDFDSDVNIHSDASPLPSDRAGGNMVMGTFGFRSGLKTKRFALRASIRPGFLSYSKAYESSPTKADPTPSAGRVTHFVTALAVSTDLELSSHLGVRFVVSNVPVRYRLARLGPERPGKPPYLNWLSREIFATNENWATQSGLVLRF